MTSDLTVTLHIYQFEYFYLDLKLQAIISTFSRSCKTGSVHKDTAAIMYGLLLYAKTTALQQNRTHIQLNYDKQSLNYK